VWHWLLPFLLESSFERSAAVSAAPYSILEKGMNGHTNQWLAMLFPEFGAHPRDCPLLLPDPMRSLFTIILQFHYYIYIYIYIYLPPTLHMMSCYNIHALLHCHLLIVCFSIWLTFNCLFHMSSYVTVNMRYLLICNCFVCLSTYLTENEDITRSFTLPDTTHNKNGI
jgi:hypothetical protein